MPAQESGPVKSDTNNEISISDSNADPDWFQITLRKSTEIYFINLSLD